MLYLLHMYPISKQLAYSAHSLEPIKSLALNHVILKNYPRRLRISRSNILNDGEYMFIVVRCIVIDKCDNKLLACEWLEGSMLILEVPSQIQRLHYLHLPSRSCRKHNCLI